MESTARIAIMLPRLPGSRRTRRGSALGLGMLLALLSGCSLFAPKFERPNLSVTNIQLLDGNFFAQNFLVRLKIQNPNNQSLPVNGLNADLKIAGEPFASGVTNRAFTVPAFGETEFEMTVSANMAMGLLKLLAKNQDQRDSIDYQLDGKVSIDRAFMRSIPFHQSGQYSLKGKNFTGS
jgi:LEA14-like dessication related protein